MNRRSVLAAVAAGGTAALAATLPNDAEAKAAEGRKLLQEFAAALSAHDIDRFAALIADDYIQHQAVAGPAAPGGLSAKQGAVNYFAARLKALPDLKVTVEAIVANGDMAAGNFVSTGTHKAEYFGFPPTGKRVTFNATDIFRIRNGKLAEHWGAADLAGLMRQLKG